MAFGFSGEGDGDRGVGGFAGAVDYTAHDGDFEVGDLGVFFLPSGEALGDFFIDLGGEGLEEFCVGAAAAGAGGNFGFEVAEFEGLEDFFADFDFAGARGVFVRGDGDADGVADAFVK